MSMYSEKYFPNKKADIEDYLNYFTIYSLMDVLINTLEKRHVPHILSIDGRLFYITFNCVFPFIVAL